MAITLIAGIKQANNGTFALVDSNDIHGGLYHVDKLIEIQDIPLERIKDGMLCYVSEKKLYYKCNAVLDENKKVAAVEWEELIFNNSGGSSNEGDSNIEQPDSTIDDIYSHIFVSDIAPENLDMFWYDTTEDEVNIENNSYTLADAKASIDSLITIVNALEDRIKFLEENGVVSGGGGSSSSAIETHAVEMENGKKLLLENGRVAVMESYQPDSSDKTIMDDKIEALLRSSDKLLLED